jgi:hypothetical protein
VDVADLDLRFPVTLGEDFFKSCLEDTHVVVDDGLLLRWVVLAHDAHQSKISVSIVSTIIVPELCKKTAYLLISRK